MKKYKLEYLEKVKQKFNDIQPSSKGYSDKVGKSSVHKDGKVQQSNRMDKQR